MPFRAYLLMALFLVALLPSLAGATGREPAPDAAIWASRGAAGEIQVHLYFFWSKRCPHCLKAQPFVARLASDYSWLIVHSAELSEHPENVQNYIRMASALGQKATSVPAFLLCGEMRVGFDAPATTGEDLRKALRDCREQASQGRLPGAGRGRAPPLAVPLLGAIDPAQASLPLFTIALAALDAFNPCAFFVLLFLLSLLVHGGSRRRMLVIGSVFVIFSGLVYFIFMAAWLNAFLLMKELQTATRIAGLVAVVIALINIKDYFWFKQGVSLSIPESAKPGLFKRMRALTEAASWPAMLAGTAALALAANTYELFCTAGFPMVFTRVLTLRNLPGADYYLYLLLYNVVYVLPLLAIMLAFVFTFGSRKLTERQGRILKLLSGSMMLGLGGALLLAPDILNSVRGAAALLAAAGALTALVAGAEKWREAAGK